MRWKSFVPGRFGSDDRGTVALLFALTLIPLFIVVGLAIDGARAYYTNTKLLAVLDSAALAAAKSLRERELSDDEVRDIAQNYVNRHMDQDHGRDITANTLGVVIDRSRNTLRLSLVANVATYFGGIINKPIFSVSQTATALFGAKQVELGMMLDVSGSMNDFGKIDDLKSAVRTLLDIMIPEETTSTKVRIGYAPFSTSVNAGSYKVQVTGIGGSSHCVTERTGTAAFLDSEPTGSNRLKARTSSCPASEIVPITNNKRDLIREVNELATGGVTAGHLGAAWAWYLISPDWSSIWPTQSAPKPYSDATTIKSVVLMTDGMFNQAYEAANGSSATQAQQVCSNIKARGIIVYTIGFQAPPEVLPILRNCATTSTHFFDAHSSSALTAAFAKIAAELTDLRLAN